MMASQLADRLVNKAVCNKTHTASYRQFRLVLDNNFIYEFYINGKLKLITGDHEKVATYISYEIQEYNKGGSV